MDDTRTRQKLDDLADLFLTGVVDDLAPTAEDIAGARPGADLLEGPAPIRLAPKTADQGSAPLDAQPDLPDQTDATASPHDPAQDSHPMLRLTQDEIDAAETTQTSSEEPNPTPPEPQAPGRAVVEAVVMGNLPGLSGPWLVQYAQLIAQSDGPVAVLHVADDAIDVELVEPRPEAQPAPNRPTATLRIPPMRNGRTGLLGLLDGLVRASTGPVQTVLVRLEPTTDPRDLSRLAAIQDWTVLLGSDESSIAGARHMLNQLTQADPRLASRHVGVMVMGSDESAAARAADTLAQQSGDLLTEPVEFIGHLQRMQPVQVRQLGTFADPVALWPQLVSWFDALELPDPQAAAPMTPEPDLAREPKTKTAAGPAGGLQSPREQPKPEREAVTPPAPESKSTAPEPRSAPAPRPSPFQVPLPPAPNFLRRQQNQPAAAIPPHTSTEGASTPGPTTQTKPEQPARETTSAKPQATTPQKPTPTPPLDQTPAPQPVAQRPATAAQAPAPAPAPQPRPASAARNLKPTPELDLASLLADTAAALAGPTLLDARIPDQPGTQLVVDDAGLIHILLRHSTLTRDADAASADPKQAILNLIQANKWVAEHLELIALTQRDHEFVTAEPTLHLLTDRADLAMGLVGRLGGSLKLHLLQEVKLGRESGWFCTPLN